MPTPGAGVEGRTDCAKDRSEKPEFGLTRGAGAGVDRAAMRGAGEEGEKVRGVTERTDDADLPADPPKEGEGLETRGDGAIARGVGAAIREDDMDGLRLGENDRGADMEELEGRWAE